MVDSEEKFAHESSSLKLSVTMTEAYFTFLYTLHEIQNSHV